MPWEVLSAAEREDSSLSLSVTQWHSFEDTYANNTDTAPCILSATTLCILPRSLSTESSVKNMISSVFWCDWLELGKEVPGAKRPVVHWDGLSNTCYKISTPQFIQMCLSLLYCILIHICLAISTLLDILHFLDQICFSDNEV